MVVTSHWATEYSKRGSAAEEINFYFNTILINLNINSKSHVCLVTTLLDQESLNDHLVPHSFIRSMILSEMMK